MAFKDLQKLIQQSSASEQNKQFERLRNKPFWIWDIKVDIDGVLDKKATSYDDIFDAYRLSLQNVIYEGEGGG